MPLQSGHKKAGRIQGRLGSMSAGTGSAVDPPLSPFLLTISWMQSTECPEPRVLLQEKKMHSSFQNDIRTSTMGINNRCQEQLLTISSSSFRYILCRETKGFQWCFGLGCSRLFPVLSYCRAESGGRALESHRSEEKNLNY